MMWELAVWPGARLCGKSETHRTRSLVGAIAVFARALHRRVTSHKMGLRKRDLLDVSPYR